jgi:hypothetical protein
MCGNPRRYLHERTIQERRWFQEVQDELEQTEDSDSTGHDSR